MERARSRRVWWVTERLLRSGKLAVVLFFPALLNSATADELGIGVPYIPTELNCLEKRDAVSCLVMSNVASGLTAIGTDGMAVPAIAESVIREDDGARWVARLRSGLTFPSGQLVTGQGLKRSFESLKANVVRSRPSSDGSDLAHRALLGIRDIEVRETLRGEEIVFSLSAPDPEFDRALSFIPLVDTAVQERAGDNTFRGTFMPFIGPYIVRENSPERNVVLEATRVLSFVPVPRSEAIRFQPFTQARLALSALRAGSIDIIPLPTPALVEAAEADPTLQVIESPLAHLSKLGHSVKTERATWSAEGDFDRLMSDKIIVRRELRLDEDALSRFDLRGTYLP